MPEGSFPNLPVLLSSSTFPEVVSLLHLPEELELLSEAMFVESLNPLVFYTFLTPDKDGESHEQEVKPWTGGMNGEQQELGVYKSCTDSSDSTFACLLALRLWDFETLNLSGPQCISTELEVLREEWC